MIRSNVLKSLKIVSAGRKGCLALSTRLRFEIVEIDKGEERKKEAQGKMFVNMFRGSANYIANHRNTIAVYHIPGGLLDSDDPNLCRDLMNDIALTWLLGMKIVLVVGCRHQIDKRIPHRDTPNGLHVTDKDTLRVVKEEAGYVRFEVERQLARALRAHGGTSKDSRDGNVVSGNFYSAQPFGILNGVDYMYTGFVRRVEVDKIRQVHDGHDICLLTTLGVSPSGEVFNVNSESLAAVVAGALGASKIIFFTDRNIVVRNKDHGKQVQHLRVTDARNVLAYNEVEVEKRGVVLVGDKVKDEDPAVLDTLTKIGFSNVALEAGVKRAHIIAPTHGSVLQELYTRDGSGTLISRDLYEGIRRATVNDISGICDLIQPLIQAGTLVDRPRAKLEQDIDSYYVYTRDNLVVACAQLKRFENNFAEIGCLVVSRDYRSQGRGDAMLGYLERICLQNDVRDVFVLSTQTMEWFVERGFDMVDVPRLPPSRQATYNWERNSKIYMKHIDDDRELDASELWWNR
jgi:amino-acid N-acetyltransferase